MPINEALATRIRTVIGDEPGVAEKKMFGGLGFLINGHMACAASSKGQLMVRFDPDSHTEAAARQGAKPFEMRGKTMRGWLFVDQDAIDDQAFRAWVEQGVDYAKSLPPK